MKIRTRLVIYFSFLVTALIVLRSVYIYYDINEYNNGEFYKRLRAKALTSAFIYYKIDEIDPLLQKRIDSAQEDLLQNENISIYSLEGKELYTNNDSINFTTSQALFDEIHAKQELHYTEGPYKILGMYYTYQNQSAYITAGAIDDDGTNLLQRIREILLLTLLGSAIATLVAGFFFVSKVLEPIKNLVSKIKKISPVERSERLPRHDSGDEIGILIDTFNDLFDQLEDSFKLEKSFVASVSHEVNNPLTKIKSQIEVSLIKDRSETYYRESLQSLLYDVNELIELIQNLSKLSKLSSGMPIEMSTYRVDELLFDVRDNLLAMHPDYTIVLDFVSLPQNQGDLIFYGNRALMSTALRNLIDNSCKYSENKTAQVKLAVNDSGVTVMILDNGKGISEKDLPHIFEPFYRSSTSENVPGSGIGLALAQRALKLHHCSIEVSSKKGQGATFTVTLSKHKSN